MGTTPSTTEAMVPTARGERLTGSPFKAEDTCPAPSESLPRPSAGTGPELPGRLLKGGSGLSRWIWERRKERGQFSSLLGIELTNLTDSKKRDWMNTHQTTALAILGRWSLHED